MSEVKVTCPQCKHVSALQSEVLNRTNGRAICQACGHMFQLVRKSKPVAKKEIEISKEEEQELNIAKRASAAALESLATLFDNFDAIRAHKEHKESKDKTPAQPEKQKPAPSPTPPAEAAKPNTKPADPAKKQPAAAQAQSTPKPAAPKIEPTVAQLKKLNRPQQPLQYRVPAFKEHTFAEVNTFTLLDRDSAHQHFPQIAMKPAAQGSKNSSTTIGGANSEQQNNITIHTDSLVFTLVGDNQSGANTLPQPAPHAQPPAPPAPTAPAQPSHHSEFNWMMASIIALTILILQLFYWLLMMM